MVGYAVFGIEPIPATDKAQPTVIVSDVLTTPGQPVQLQTRVFEESLLGRKIGLGGETLEFLVEKQVVGTTMTGGDGRAFWEYAPRMRGNFTITVRVPESPRVLSAEGKGLLASWERKKPILLIDLVSVMQEKSNPELPLPSFPINFSPTDLGEPDKDAPQELEKLSRCPTSTSANSVVRPIPPVTLVHPSFSSCTINSSRAWRPLGIILGKPEGN